MQAEERIEPSSVAEFLGLHQLDSYAAAFDEEGWDSLQQLRTVDASALEQLITDVKMKSGHAFRLRAALGKGGAAQPAAEVVAGGAPGVVPGPAQHGAAGLPTPAPGQETLTGPAAKAAAKMVEMTIVGELVHGNIVETWANPATNVPVVAFSQDGDSFYCRLCPVPRRSDDGKRACGRYFCNMFVHLGSNIHWTQFRKQVHGFAYDEALWQKYTDGNQYGPSRAKHKRSGELTKAASARKAQTWCNAQKHLTATKRAKARGQEEADGAAPFPASPMPPSFATAFGSPAPLPTFTVPPSFIPGQAFMPAAPAFYTSPIMRPPPGQPLPTAQPPAPVSGFDYTARAAELQDAPWPQEQDSAAAATEDAAPAGEDAVAGATAAEGEAPVVAPETMAPATAAATSPNMDPTAAAPASGMGFGALAFPNGNAHTTARSY